MGAPTAFTGRTSVARDASIADTIAELQGPEIFWGSEGVLVGKDEADIKGYDNFSKLSAALSAFEKHEKEVGTPITADVLKYHVIPGKKTLDMLTTDQETLQGGTLTSYRKFRKNWLDFAIVGLKSEGPSKGSNWPADVEADNGIIHGIDTVLVPGAYTGSR